MKRAEINKILRENKDLFDSLARYDETMELPFQRKKINLTLSVEVINKLKRMKEKTGKPISRIVEERFMLA
jgi:hypothetical protein